jgi:alpha-mannosidase
VFQGRLSEERTASRLTQEWAAVIDLPVGAEGEKARSAETVACPVRTRVTRWRGVPRLEYETIFDNRARDHRLRVCFQPPSGAGFNPLPYSIAEGQFDVLRRPLIHPLENEGASPFHPQQNWAALTGGHNAAPGQLTFALLNQGLPEYEVYSEPQGPRLAVTLLRAVNYISRRGDGPQIETPEAQCPGVSAYHYASLETDGTWEDGALWKQAWQFNVPLRAVQTGGASSVRPLPSSLSFISVEPASLVVTAIKRSEDNPEQVILRFFNISDSALEGGTARLRGAVSAWYANLNEEPLALLATDEDGGFHLRSIRPKEIVTLLVALKA